MGGENQRIGLALSGGGFRAAFFHIGVLARLAELGILPKVEVISTVSGGSIVGALYYLRLKELLEEHPDGEIGKQHYVDLVANVERRLLDGTRKNIRARVFTNAIKNLAMLSPRYSRSDRIGDLYDRHFYKRAWGADPGARSLGREKQIEVRGLLVEPDGTTPFDPNTDNAGRHNKVPILLLNATSLNSGHNWRFEAVRMGEPLPEDPAHAAVVNEIDKNMRLEQAYFDPAPGQVGVPAAQHDFPLGLAVAASAAVPGVFQPLAISDMYEGIRVQLVDGGVQDNQGVQGLFDRDCTHLIVSDASGQMDDKEKPAPQILSVLIRSSSVGQSRVRIEQLIAADRYEYALMHLRKGLPDKTVRVGHSRADAVAEGAGTAGTEAFGVAAPVQAALSNIRTDLDFFTDTEAHSLALDGYLMSAYELEEEAFDRLGDGGAEADPSGWAFGSMKEQISSGGDGYLSHLQAGSKSFFRLLAARRIAGLGWGAMMIAVLALIAGAILWPTLCLLCGEPWWLVVVGGALAASIFVALALFVSSNLNLLKGKLYPN
jgi:NTE family protein